MLRIFQRARRELMTEKIKSLIENSKSFALLLDDQPEEHEFLAKEILKEVINNKGLPVLTLPEDPEELKKKWALVAQSANSINFPQKTALKLPKTKYQIQEISYKDDGENLSFIITSPNDIILKEDISLEKLPPEAETVFCFFENREKIEKFKNLLCLPAQEKIIFFEQGEKTLTEKIFNIAQIFDPQLLNNEKISTLLYAALLLETRNFTEKTSKDTLALASLLLENGVQQEIISSVAEAQKNVFSAQLIGRLLARTFIDDALGVSWSFLNSRDLQKTNNISASPSLLYKMIQQAKTLIPIQKLHILLWQTTEGIKALVAVGGQKTEKYLLPIAEKMDTKPCSKFFISGPFETFSEAELKLREIIKEE